MAKSKLEKLQDKAVELGVEFTPDTTEGQLEALIETKKEEIKAAKKADKAYQVKDAAGVVIMTYTEELHGKEAKELAEKNAAKRGGSVEIVEAE